ncbi:hypothetical protein GBF38_022321, partial [Nibea albiflora]
TVKTSTGKQNTTSSTGHKEEDVPDEWRKSEVLCPEEAGLEYQLIKRKRKKEQHTFDRQLHIQSARQTDFTPRTARARHTGRSSSMLIDTAVFLTDCGCLDRSSPFRRVLMDRVHIHAPRYILKMKHKASGQCLSQTAMAVFKEPTLVQKLLFVDLWNVEQPNKSRRLLEKEKVTSGEREINGLASDSKWMRVYSLARITRILQQQVKSLNVTKNGLGVDDKTLQLWVADVQKWAEETEQTDGSLGALQTRIEELVVIIRVRTQNLYRQTGMSQFDTFTNCVYVYTFFKINIFTDSNKRRHRIRKVILDEKKRLVAAVDNYNKLAEPSKQIVSSEALIQTDVWLWQNTSEPAADLHTKREVFEKRGRPRGSQNAGCLSPIPRPRGAESYVPESDSEPDAGDPQVGTRLASEEEAMDSDHSEEF